MLYDMLAEKVLQCLLEDRPLHLSDEEQQTLERRFIAVFPIQVSQHEVLKLERSGGNLTGSVVTHDPATGMVTCNHTFVSCDVDSMRTLFEMSQ